MHEWLLALLMRIDVFLSHWLRAAGNEGCGSMAQLGKLAAHREALLQVYFFYFFYLAAQLATHREVLLQVLSLLALLVQQYKC